MRLAGRETLVREDMVDANDAALYKNNTTYRVGMVEVAARRYGR